MCEEQSGVVTPLERIASICIEDPSYLTPLDNPGYDYHPTNGTISKGDIIRVAPKSNYPGNYLYPDKVE